MTEDEALNILKTMCTDNFCIEQLKTKQAIETILDLYQKEKEKNKRYEKYLKSKDKQHEQVLEYLEAEKENEYLSKDKIRAKIEEYEQLAERNKDGKYWTDEAILYDRQAEVLRELLEEE